MNWWMFLLIIALFGISKLLMSSPSGTLSKAQSCGMLCVSAMSRMRVGKMYGMSSVLGVSVSCCTLMTKD